MLEGGNGLNQRQDIRRIPVWCARFNTSQYQEAELVLARLFIQCIDRVWIVIKRLGVRSDEPLVVAMEEADELIAIFTSSRKTARAID